ncbi:hypothetical protein OIV83_004358 [Microbotryomycetes sp. JL201]|nr:hypothetical protein OIV83_004267 [Microbotryomycetes sp. JL201]KAK4049209.1 hypothetical protein OIV83_004358 [Microbotryomycetes sp. JL201]
MGVKGIIKMFFQFSERVDIPIPARDLDTPIQEILMEHLDWRHEQDRTKLAAGTTLVYECGAGKRDIWDAAMRSVPRPRKLDGLTRTGPGQHETDARLSLDEAGRTYTNLMRSFGRKIKTMLDNFSLNPNDVSLRMAHDGPLRSPLKLEEMTRRARAAEERAVRQAGRDQTPLNAWHTIARLQGAVVFGWEQGDGPIHIVPHNEGDLALYAHLRRLRAQNIPASQIAMWIGESDQLVFVDPADCRWALLAYRKTASSPKMVYVLDLEAICGHPEWPFASHQQLCAAATLVGHDYFKGVQGIGMTTAQRPAGLALADALVAADVDAAVRMFADLRDKDMQRCHRLDERSPEVKAREVIQAFQATMQLVTGADQRAVVVQRGELAVGHVRLASDELVLRNPVVPGLQPIVRGQVAEEAQRFTFGGPAATVNTFRHARSKVQESLVEGGIVARTFRRRPPAPANDEEGIARRRAAQPPRAARLAGVRGRLQDVLESESDDDLPSNVDRLPRAKITSTLLLVGKKALAHGALHTLSEEEVNQPAGRRSALEAMFEFLRETFAFALGQALTAVLTEVRNVLAAPEYNLTMYHHRWTSPARLRQLISAVLCLLGTADDLQKLNATEERMPRQWLSWHWSLEPGRILERAEMERYWRGLSHAEQSFLAGTSLSDYVVARAVLIVIRRGKSLPRVPNLTSHLDEVSAVSATAIINATKTNAIECIKKYAAMFTEMAGYEALSANERKALKDLYYKVIVNSPLSTVGAARAPQILNEHIQALGELNLGDIFENEVLATMEALIDELNQHVLTPVKPNPEKASFQADPRQQLGSFAAGRDGKTFESLLKTSPGCLMSYLHFVKSQVQRHHWLNEQRQGRMLERLPLDGIVANFKWQSQPFNLQRLTAVLIDPVAHAEACLVWQVDNILPVIQDVWQRLLARIDPDGLQTREQKIDLLKNEPFLRQFGSLSSSFVVEHVLENTWLDVVEERVEPRLSSLFVRLINAVVRSLDNTFPHITQSELDLREAKLVRGKDFKNSGRRGASEGLDTRTDEYGRQVQSLRGGVKRFQGYGLALAALLGRARMDHHLPYPRFIFCPGHTVTFLLKASRVHLTERTREIVGRTKSVEGLVTALLLRTEMTAASRLKADCLGPLVVYERQEAPREGLNAEEVPMDVDEAEERSRRPGGAVDLLAHETGAFEDVDWLAFQRKESESLPVDIENLGPNRDATLRQLTKAVWDCWMRGGLRARVETLTCEDQSGDPYNIRMQRHLPVDPAIFAPDDARHVSRTVDLIAILTIDPGQRFPIACNLRTPNLQGVLVERQFLVSEMALQEIKGNATSQSQERRQLITSAFGDGEGPPADIVDVVAASGTMASGQKAMRFLSTGAQLDRLVQEVIDFAGLFGHKEQRDAVKASSRTRVFDEANPVTARMFYPEVPAPVLVAVGDAGPKGAQGMSILRRLVDRCRGSGASVTFVRLDEFRTSQLCPFPSCMDEHGRSPRMARVQKRVAGGPPLPNYRLLQCPQCRFVLHRDKLAAMNMTEVADHVLRYNEHPFKGDVVQGEGGDADNGRHHGAPDQLGGGNGGEGAAMDLDDADGLEEDLEMEDVLEDGFLDAGGNMHNQFGIV